MLAEKKSLDGTLFLGILLQYTLLTIKYDFLKDFIQLHVAKFKEENASEKKKWLQNGIN